MIMNNNNKRKYKIPRKQTSYLTKAIIYGVFGLLCLSNIKQLWSIMLILLAVAAFYGYLWDKHKHDKSFLEFVKAVWKDGEEPEEEDDKKYENLNRKEQKKTFQDYLAEVDRQFNDEELDRQLAELEDSENSDLYIR